MISSFFNSGFRDAKSISCSVSQGSLQISAVFFEALLILNQFNDHTLAFKQLLISAPRLLVYSIIFVVDSVCLSICPSVCLFVTNIASSFFLFLGGIEPFLGHQYSVTKTTRLFSSIFDLGPPDAQN